MSDLTIFVCTRDMSKPRCNCGRASIGSCSFPLTGPKTGKTCPKLLCEKCAVQTKEELFCVPHWNIKLKQWAAEESQREAKR